MLNRLAQQLALGATTSRALVEACLVRIADPSGEGSRAFTFVDAERALEVASAMDRLRAAGSALSAYAGIPVSVKDNFDIAGQPTRAGSKVLDDAAPATADSPVVRRLRRAGLVIIGRTNMTEFAFSGIGLNRAHGTPRCVWNRAVGHVPGGSSSGAAVSVADGMAHAALCTDTGGSSRVPAAFNGLVGFKPTATRVSIEGTIPISQTLDSVGYIGRTAACCAVLDAIATDARVPCIEPLAISRLRFAVPLPLLQRGTEAEVAEAFGSAVESLASSGARVERVPLESLALADEINVDGGIASTEGYAWHRGHIERRRAQYDPGVLRRIELGARQSGEAYLRKLAMRRAFQAQIEKELREFDAVLFPTAGLLPPRLADLADNPVLHDAVHAEVLYNSRMVNLMDGCAISIPVHRPGAAPVGFTIACTRGRDEWLLRCACTIEATLNRLPKEETNA